MPKGLRATRPSVTGVGDVLQVFDLSTNLPAKAGIDLAALHAAQMTYVDAAHLARMKGFSFLFMMFNEIKLICDVSTGLPHPVVPEEFRRRVFDAIHNLSHAGTRATK